MYNSNISSQFGRIPSMDGMRFLMCVGIAALHFSSYFWSNNNFFLKFAYFTDIFFIISGYFLARSTNKDPIAVNNFKRYLTLRFMRIYPLYFVTLSFYILVGFVTMYGYLEPDNPDRYNLSKVWPHLLLIQSWGGMESLIFNYPAWSLSALWFLYLCFPILYVLANKHKVATYFFILGFIAIGELFARNYCIPTTSLTKVQECDAGLLRAIPSFLFGIVLARIQIKKIHSVWCISLVALTTTLLFILPIYWEGTIRLAIIYAFLYSFLLADKCGLKTPLSLMIFGKLAKFSYGIYLIHPIIATIFISYLLPLVFDLEALYLTSYSLAYKIVFFSASLILSLIAAICSYYMLEKPVYKIGRALFKNDKKNSYPTEKL